MTTHTEAQESYMAEEIAAITRQTVTMRRGVVVFAVLVLGAGLPSLAGSADATPEFTGTPLTYTR
jgi:hypothetical protein